MVKGSPAHKAGILNGDFLVKIEDNLTIFMDMKQVVEKLNTEKTIQTITIER